MLDQRFADALGERRLVEPSTGPFRSAAARPRMRRLVDLAQVLLRDERVDLRRRDARVTEQLLHHPDVGASLQQMRREGVSQGVQGDASIDPAAATRRRAARTAWRVSRPPRWFRKRAARLAAVANAGRARVR